MKARYLHSYCNCNMPTVVKSGFSNLRSPFSNDIYPKLASAADIFRDMDRQTHRHMYWTFHNIRAIPFQKVWRGLGKFFRPPPPALIFGHLHIPTFTKVLLHWKRPQHPLPDGKVTVAQLVSALEFTTDIQLILQVGCRIHSVASPT